MLCFRKLYFFTILTQPHGFFALPSRAAFVTHRTVINQGHVYQQEDSKLCVTTVAAQHGLADVLSRVWQSI